jgi:hypothetical protein
MTNASTVLANKPVKTKETLETPSLKTPDNRNHILQDLRAINPVSEFASRVSELGLQILNKVRNNDSLISSTGTNQGVGVTQLQNDLNAISDILAKKGIKIDKVAVSGSFDKQTEKVVEQLQSIGMISETGDAFVKINGKFHKIDIQNGEITNEIYSGNFKGLAKDGQVGPRTYRFIDALLGRKDALLSFDQFKSTTNGLWDISQVPEDYQEVAGDGAGYTGNTNFQPNSEIERRIQKYLGKNNPHAVPRGCFRYSWEAAGKVLGVGIQSALDRGETNAMAYRDTSLRGQGFEAFKNAGLRAGDVIYVNKVPGTDETSMNMANKPHWAVVIGNDSRGYPIFSDNWGTFSTERFTTTFGRDRKIDAIYRNSRHSTAN